MKNVIIIGGGASGMFCGIFAARQGLAVTILEQNERLGKKLFITGKGRCNFTNDCTPEEFRGHVLSNPRFLYSASASLSPSDVIRYFEDWGLRTKVERGRRAFPASDHSSDVIDTLKKELKKRHVEVRLNTEVTGIIVKNGRAAGVKVRRMVPEMSSEHKKREEDLNADASAGMEEELYADAVVIATGGMSYPSTGSTGDGFSFAAKLGMSVTETYPSLVPVNCREEYVKELQGLSLKNVRLVVREGKRILYNEFGEMMFTHFGITGPLVLSMSAKIGPEIQNHKERLGTRIDLKPAVSEEQLDARVIRLFDANRKKALKNVLHELFPAKMIDIIPDLAGISPDARCCDLTKRDRTALISVTKHFPLTVTSLRGYDEAVITKGGISVREIDPKTMEAKNVPGLYCIGEVLDLDAYTGGYNLQIAWCTAYACAAALGSEA